MAEIVRSALIVFGSEVPGEGAVASLSDALHRAGVNVHRHIPEGLGNNSPHAHNRRVSMLFDKVGAADVLTMERGTGNTTLITMGSGAFDLALRVVGEKGTDGVGGIVAVDPNISDEDEPGVQQILATGMELLVCNPNLRTRRIEPGDFPKGAEVLWVPVKSGTYLRGEIMGEMLRNPKVREIIVKFTQKPRTRRGFRNR